MGLFIRLQLFFCPNQFLGQEERVLSSQIEEPQKNTMVGAPLS